MQNEFFHISVYLGNMGFFGLACNDHFFMIRLLKSNGDHDTRYILCNDKEVLEWGKDLFEHYLKTSIPITEL
uniref:transcriptional regulator FilR1 domain-containing protein n=1 Tax=Methanolobus psychrotolerans TaxID=1874706 RepID=UPI000B919507|nr:transcriptional regulator FilR1 domain-containing protein [Methanolobus psychrotolerans]